ncbi:hypothetical protein Nmel_002101, partial [Mimus melanotis]
MPKMLQIQPKEDTIVEFIRNEDFKYVQMLGALYMRLTGTAIYCYKSLEPLHSDRQKIPRNGEFELMNMDELIDELLHEEGACDIILPHLQKQNVLEKLSSWSLVSVLWKNTWMVQNLVRRRKMKSWNESHLQTTAGECTDMDKPSRSPVVWFRSARRHSCSPKRSSPSLCRERHRRKSPRWHQT